MVKPQVSMLCSVSSHMGFLSVWRDSGIPQKHGFDLIVDVCNVKVDGRPFIDRRDRAQLLLDEKYDMLSGLHHETYIYRAKGEKRFMYLAQAQNDWDDRVVASEDVKSPKDLEGKRFLATSGAPCVLGNLKHSLRVAGVDLDRVDFVKFGQEGTENCAQAVEAVAEGEAAATMVDPPFDLRGVKRGLHRLDIPSIPVIHNATICANREWVLKNEETTIAFLKSMIESIHFFKTEKDRSCEILERSVAPMLRLEGSDEIEHLHKTWADLLSPKPYPHPLAVWNVYNLDVAHDPKTNFIGPFEIWDTSYLRDIDDSGFVDQLYGTAREAVNPAVNAAI